MLAHVTSCAKLTSSIDVDASSATYVRTDSDATTVMSPRGQAAVTFGDTLTWDAGYAVDAWSGASVDVITAATQTIRETRQEVTGGGRYAGEDWSVGGNYRYSTEPDYRSHGGSLRAAVDLFERNTTLALDVFGARDVVGRVGDPAFQRPVFSAGGRLSYVQVIDKKTVGEVSWESMYIDGFQASPYRWVAIGGDGTCSSTAPLCVPETHPTERWRHAANVRARRAFGKRWSLGMQYRYYFDSWGLQAHTIEPDLAWLPTRRRLNRDTLSLHYRYYTQGEAKFYLPRYFEPEAASLGYVTRDRKLSAMLSHAFGPSYVHRFDAGNTDIQPLLGLSLRYSLLHYLAFVGLERVHAGEITAMFGVELR